MLACLMNSVKRVCVFVRGGGCGWIVGEVCHFLAHEGLGASCAGLVLPGGRCLQCCLHDPSSVPAPAPAVCFTPRGG